MSTRSSYIFNTIGEQGDIAPTTAFYVHHDGYEAGAAAKFWAMINHAKHGNLAARFMRSNDRAEFINADASGHMGEEFCYTITEHHGQEPYLTAKSCDIMTDELTTIYTGTLREFINKHDGMLPQIPRYPNGTDSIVMTSHGIAPKTVARVSWKEHMDMAGRLMMQGKGSQAVDQIELAMKDSKELGLSHYENGLMNSALAHIANMVPLHKSA